MALLVIVWRNLIKVTQRERGEEEEESERDGESERV